jgi:cobalt-zinc-cadmium efflux system protein
MAHDHHHHHAGGHGRAFVLGIGLNVAFIVVETVFGFLTDSLALLADAGHNFGDVLGLLLAWGGTLLARRVPTQRRTYGLRRSTILAALLNAVILLVVVGGIGWEAIQRLGVVEPQPGPAMIWVAAVGIFINGASALLFLRGSEHDVNLRGAFLHLAADAVVSLGVVVAGLVIRYTGWTWVDPVVSLVIAVVILLSTWQLLVESLDLALDAVPRGIDPQQVRDYLASIPGAVDVHDLHIWGLSTTEAALTAHLVIPHVDNRDALLAQIGRELHERFRIEHVTIQLDATNTNHDACDTPGAAKKRSCADHDHA